MKKLRDSQRTKVTQALNKWRDITKNQGLKIKIYEFNSDIRNNINKILLSAWYKKLFDEEKIKSIDVYHHKIKVSTSSLSFGIKYKGAGNTDILDILIFICWGLSEPNERGHGTIFCQNILKMTKHKFGKEAYVCMKQCFDNKKVKYIDPFEKLRPKKIKEKNVTSTFMSNLKKIKCIINEGYEDRLETGKYYGLVEKKKDYIIIQLENGEKIELFKERFNI